MPESQRRMILRRNVKCQRRIINPNPKRRRRRIRLHPAPHLKAIENPISNPRINSERAKLIQANRNKHNYILNTPPLQSRL